LPYNQLYNDKLKCLAQPEERKIENRQVHVISGWATSRKHHV